MKKHVENLRLGDVFRFYDGRTRILCGVVNESKYFVKLVYLRSDGSVFSGFYDKGEPVEIVE